MQCSALDRSGRSRGRGGGLKGLPGEMLCEGAERRILWMPLFL
jgi:hypothetical protein